ncbi:MAG: hypothetical protein ACM3X7_06985 [Solirubrobacterales bacterium]
MENNFKILFDNEEERIKTSLAEFIRKSLNLSVTDFISSDLYKNFKLILKDHIISAAHSKEFEGLVLSEIEKKISEIEKEDTTFKEFLPKGFENNIKVYIYNNSPAIIEGIKKAIRNKDTENRIKAEINKFAGGVNPLAAKFINADNLYLKLASGVDNYFNSPDAARELVQNASNLIDQGMEKEIKNITMYFPYEGKKSIAEGLRDAVIDALFNEEAVLELLNSLEKEFCIYDNIYPILLKVAPNLEELILQKSEEIYEYIKLN